MDQGILKNWLLDTHIVFWFSRKMTFFKLKSLNSLLKTKTCQAKNHNPSLKLPQHSKLSQGLWRSAHRSPRWVNVTLEARVTMLQAQGKNHRETDAMLKPPTQSEPKSLIAHDPPYRRDAPRSGSRSHRKECVSVPSGTLIASGLHKPIRESFPYKEPSLFIGFLYGTLSHKIPSSTHSST